MKRLLLPLLISAALPAMALAAVAPTTGNNTSTVVQSADQGEVRVDQSAGASNLSEVTQQPAADGAVAKVTQSSLSNSSKVLQLGAGDTATVTQKGGAGNVSDVIQNGFNDGAAATVTQDGVGALSKILQGSGAEAVVSQTSIAGAQNVSTVTQGPEASVIATGADALGSYAEVKQNGAGNIGTVLQHSANSDIYMEQIGDTYQEAMTTQHTGSDGSTAETRQLGGSYNFSQIDQSSPSSEAYVTQNGLQNVSTVSQSLGAGNYALVSQTGAYGQSYVTQQGDNNRATVNQAQDYALSTILQQGSNNEASVTQGVIAP
jgi:hypothetical protein